MTTCIAALADNGASVVLVADQLYDGLFSYFTETDAHPKIHYVGDAAILTSGDRIITDEIVERTRIQPSPNGLRLAQAVAQHYCNVRDRKIEQTCLARHGLSFRTYIDDNAKLHPYLIAAIDREIVSFDLGVGLLTVERIGEKYVICQVLNPGRLDMVGGFHVIGVGQWLAYLAMMDQDYDESQPLAEVEAMVLKAKQRSEKSRLVGEKTSLGHLPRRDGEPKTVSASRAPA